MIPRLRALFACIMACMAALLVLRVTLRALAMATPGVLTVVVLFIAHELGRPCRVH